jgi:hypothetical protein
VPLASGTDLDRQRSGIAIARRVNPRTWEIFMTISGAVSGCVSKTQLERCLFAGLTGRGLRVSTMKRVPDTINLEKPGSEHY